VLTELARGPEELWEEARLGARRLQVEHSPRLALEHLETVLAGIGVTPAGAGDALPAARRATPRSPIRGPSAPGRD
jgi:hypothetical protein